MKIAVANWSRRRAGGVESYLADVMPRLIQRGHGLALVAELDAPSDRESIAPPGLKLDLDMAATGVDRLLDSLRAWTPDVVFTHQLHDITFERSLMDIAPTVAFAHAYYGTCISGTKTHRLPSPHPCSRQLGPGCLLHFYPNRCGGLNPVTTARLYREQTSRRELMRRHTAVVTFSDHMAEEYHRHGIPATKLWRTSADVGAVSRDRDVLRVPPAPGEPWRLMFLGRFELLKGVGLLLDALETIARSPSGSFLVSLVGDGVEHERIARRARRLTSQHPQIRIEMPGWLSGGELERQWELAHALVVPSVWPEPFGLAGIEAGRRGIPVVAFRVGAIPEWLEHGVNGLLVDLQGKSAANLAAGILNMISNRDAWLRMSHEARRLAARFSIENHLEPLEEILHAAASSRSRSSA